MDFKAFENLELIPKILDRIEKLEKLVARPIKTKRDAAEFLNVSTRTINSYMSSGKLKDGYHFKRKSDRIIEFIDSAIREFKYSQG